MTLTLILMRHAKSSWSSPSATDHDRPLNDRGARSARAIGDWLVEQGHVPDAVLSSDSLRTRETWDRMATAMPQTPEPHFTRALYHASAGAMLDELRGAQGAKVLMLGHNPGCAGFAEQIVASPPAHDRFEDYPTAATLVATFDEGRWADVGWATAQAQAFIVPRDLGVD